MDLVGTIRKEGSRGGRADFKWSDVQTNEHRENYLGHSLMAPVGRWQKGRDLSWYAKGDGNKTGDGLSAAEQAALERKEELQRVKQAEQEALSKALGFEVNPNGPMGPGPVEGTGANSMPITSKLAKPEVRDPERTRKTRHRSHRHDREHTSGRQRDRSRDRHSHRDHRDHHDDHHYRHRQRDRSSLRNDKHDAEYSSSDEDRSYRRDRRRHRRSPPRHDSRERSPDGHTYRQRNQDADRSRDRRKGHVDYSRRRGDSPLASRSPSYDRSRRDRSTSYNRSERHRERARGSHRSRRSRSP